MFVSDRCQVIGLGNAVTAMYAHDMPANNSSLA